MKRIRRQSEDGKVACVINGLKPHHDRDKVVVTRIDQFEANRDRMPATATGSADCRSDPALLKAPASKSSEPLQAVGMPLVESRR